MTHYTRAQDVVPGDYLLNQKTTVKVTRVERHDAEIILHLSNGKVDRLKPNDNVALLPTYDDDEA
jgi:hypothetical protein